MSLESAQPPPHDPQPIPAKKRRFIGRFKRNPQPPTIEEAQKPPFTPEEQEWIDSALERTVSLDSLNIKNLPVNFDALKGNAGLVNDLKDDPITAFDISELRPPAEVSFAIPMIASVAAHKENPNIPIEMPTTQEIKAMKPWVGRVARVIGKFSPSWEIKFNRHVEKKGADAVINAGEKLASVADAFKEVDKPQEQFVKEIHRMYEGLLQPLGGYDRHKIEVRMHYFLGTMRSAVEGKTYDSHWFNKDTFPLLTKILPIVRFPTEAMTYSETVPLAASEMMSGVERFLRQEGLHVDRAPAPSRSFMRFMAEVFASGKLDEVRQALPDILSTAKRALPENGPAFSQSVNAMTENIVVLRRQGKDPKTIVDAIFPQN